MQKGASEAPFCMDTELKAQAACNIDHSLWGLSHGSDKPLGNRTMLPISNIELDVAAKP
jgi:hypothetical protein